MHGHLNVRRIGVSESVNRCRVNVKGSGDVGNGFAFQNKATCQFTLIQSKLIHQHINMLGRYSFVVPEPVVRGELRPLRTPADEEP